MIHQEKLTTDQMKIYHGIVQEHFHLSQLPKSYQTGLVCSHFFHVQPNEVKEKST